MFFKPTLLFLGFNQKRKHLKVAFEKEKLECLYARGQKSNLRNS